MTNKEAAIWLLNLRADIGKAQHSDLWNYEQALEEIQEILESDVPETNDGKWIEIYEGQENLPPLGVDVLLCVINGKEDVGYLIKDEEGLIWKVGTWYNDFLEWDAWRYLPEEWKGGNDA